MPLTRHDLFFFSLLLVEVGRWRVSVQLVNMCYVYHLILCTLGYLVSGSLFCSRKWIEFFFHFLRRTFEWRENWTLCAFGVCRGLHELVILCIQFFWKWQTILTDMFHHNDESWELQENCCTRWETKRSESVWCFNQCQKALFSLELRVQSQDEKAALSLSLSLEKKVKKKQKAGTFSLERYFCRAHQRSETAEQETNHGLITRARAFALVIFGFGQSSLARSRAKRERGTRELPRAKIPFKSRIRPGQAEARSRTTVRQLLFSSKASSWRKRVPLLASSSVLISVFFCSFCIRSICPQCGIV